MLFSVGGNSGQLPSADVIVVFRAGMAGAPGATQLTVSTADHAAQQVGIIVFRRASCWLVARRCCAALNTSLSTIVGTGTLIHCSRGTGWTLTPRPTGFSAEP